MSLAFWVIFRWARGLTGLPFIDASLRELVATGFCSNRSRQNVASLFCKEMGLDWRTGVMVVVVVLLLLLLL